MSEEAGREMGGVGFGCFFLNDKNGYKKIEGFYFVFVLFCF